MRNKIIIFIVAIIPLSSTAQHFGKKNHPMNKHTSNVEVLRYWNNNSSEEIEIYETIFSIFSENKNITYGDLLSDEEYLSLCKKYGVHILGGPMLGNIADSQVSIWLRSSKPSKIQLELSSNEKTFLSNTIHTNVTSELAGVFKVDGLNPATSYTYGIIINDSVKIFNDKFHFKTLPAEKQVDSIRIAFGSCPHRWGLGNKKLFNAISERSPCAMFLLGDIAVQDRNDNLSMHRADYLLRDFQTAWKQFASNIPVYASWDDHDYFDNDKAGVPKGYTDKDRKGVREIFENSWVNPAYGLNGLGVFFKTKIGCAEIIMTDNRYFRGDAKSPFLGITQMDWFKEQIKNCQSPFLILSCGTMWSDYVSKGKDSWGVNDPEGRDEILNLIEENKVSAVLLISGDRHGARGFTIKRESGFELFEFGMASLGARVGPPKSKPEWTKQFYGIDGVFAFGEFTFVTNPNQKFVTFRLINENGDVLFKRKLSYENLVDKNN